MTAAQRSSSTRPRNGHLSLTFGALRPLAASGLTSNRRQKGVLLGVV